MIAFFFIKSEDKEAAEEEVTDEKRETKRLSRKALMGVYWRAHTLGSFVQLSELTGLGLLLRDDSGIKRTLSR